MQLSATHDDAHIHMHTRLHQPMQVSLYTCIYTCIVPCFIAFARPSSSALIDVPLTSSYMRHHRSPFPSPHNIRLSHRSYYHVVSHHLSYHRRSVRWFLLTAPRSVHPRSWHIMYHHSVTHYPHHRHSCVCVYIYICMNTMIIVLMCVMRGDGLDTI